MRLGTKLLASARGGLVRGAGQFVEHAVRNLLLLITGLLLLYYGSSYISSWFSGFIPDFSWPSWAHLPHWFSSDTTTIIPETLPAEIVAPAKPDDACTGWGYKSFCWRG